MTERKTITFWLAVNENGEYCIDSDGASDAHDGVGGYSVRVIELNVAVDLPTFETVNVQVETPAETKAPAQVTVS